MFVPPSKPVQPHNDCVPYKLPSPTKELLLSHGLMWLYFQNTKLGKSELIHRRTDSMV